MSSGLELSYYQYDVTVKKDLLKGELIHPSPCMFFVFYVFHSHGEHLHSSSTYVFGLAVGNEQNKMASKELKEQILEILKKSDDAIETI